MFQFSGDMKQNNILEKNVLSVSRVFSELPLPQLSHDFEIEFGLSEDPHETQLIKKIASKYATFQIET